MIIKQCLVDLEFCGDLVKLGEWVDRLVFSDLFMTIIFHYEKDLTKHEWLCDRLHAG